MLVMAPFVFIACETDNGEIGRNTIIGLPPGLDSVHLNIISFTQQVDSVLVALPYSTQLSLGGYTGSRLAGNLMDQYLGQANAGFVSQMIPNQLNTDFGTNPVIDSVKLYLRYNGSYGDTSKSMDLEVYELDQSLNRDTNFYSSFSPTLGVKLGEKLGFTPRPKSNINVDGTLISPTLVVDLETSYFTDNFANVADGSNENFADFESFIEYFKGIHVKGAGSDGAILYFNLNNSNSRIVVSYHNDSDTSEVILNFAQDKSTVPIGFSVFSQDYTNAVSEVNNPDSLSPGEFTTYTQSMGGVATVLKLPELQQLIDQQGIVINRAFIEVPVQRGLGSSLSPNSSLEIRKMSSDGPSRTIRDFNFDGSQTGGGILRLGSLRDNKYLFEVTEHVFEVVNGDANSNLAIVPVNKATTANRTILKGGADAVEPITLIVYYTKP